MTVCVAALAAKAKAIVCVADKAITYDDYIQWDADCDKIVEMNASGTVCLTSGDDESIFRIVRKLSRATGLNDSVQAATDASERAYEEAIEEEVEKQFLKPRLLDRKSYLRAITGSEINEYMLGLMKNIDDYSAADLIIAGFTTKGEPILLEMQHPGLAADAVNSGSTAIGSGAEKAVSKLLWSSTERRHPIERVLYDAFDAKANAEMAVGVGYEWDAAVIVPGKVVRVPKRIKDLIEKAWSQHDRSPFETYNRSTDVAPRLMVGRKR